MPTSEEYHRALRDQADGLRELHTSIRLTHWLVRNLRRCCHSPECTEIEQMCPRSCDCAKHPTSPRLDIGTAMAWHLAAASVDVEDAGQALIRRVEGGNGHLALDICRDIIAKTTRMQDNIRFSMRLLEYHPTEYHAIRGNIIKLDRRMLEVEHMARKVQNSLIVQAHHLRDKEVKNSLIEQAHKARERIKRDAS